MVLVLQTAVSYIFIALSVLLGLWWIYGPNFLLEHQLLLLVALTILTGLPHGALDTQIASHYGLYSKQSGKIFFLTCYVILALISMAIWWAYPKATLTLFLLISIWHFSGDWSQSIGTFKSLFISAMVICLPVLNFTLEVQQIFTVLTQSSISPLHLQKLVYVSQGLLFVCAILVIHLIVIEKYIEAMEVVCLIGIALTLPPILYFTVYFCILHSPRHLLTNIQVLRINSSKKIILSIWPAMVLIIIAGIIVARLNIENSPSDIITQIIFIGLFGLTIPHMLLIEYTKTH
jgi:Brp/Blh family beta-carotene 15,15'-monooxygenase